MFAVGDQVEVVGELDVAGEFLQDVDAEALTAQLSVGLCVTRNTAEERGEAGSEVRGERSDTTLQGRERGEAGSEVR